MALVVFLRGVNVGGHRVFRPAVLARELKPLSAVNIGAAGTFVIRAPVTRTRLREELTRRLPFATAIMICEGREILRLAAADPFARHPAHRQVIRFVSVLARRPRADPPLPLRVPVTGRWELRVLGRRDRFVLGVYRREMRAVTHLGMLDRLFGMPVTTRNWNTIMAIADVLVTEVKR